MVFEVIHLPAEQIEVLNRVVEAAAGVAVDSSMLVVDRDLNMMNMTGN